MISNWMKGLRRQTNTNDVKYPANCANRVALDATKNNGNTAGLDMKTLDKVGLVNVRAQKNV